MDITILTCFESNEERACFVYDVCKKQGHHVEIITTDFSHIKKQKRKEVRSCYRVVETKPYSNNLSLKRILSHRKFAKDAFKLVDNTRPDIIWLMAPANSLIKQAHRYKEKNPGVKLIIDIIDMWPESLPININKSIFPFNIWKNIRKKNICCADMLVTECDFYQEILKNEYHGSIETLRWARDRKNNYETVDVNDDKLSLCYLGSINNIINTELISDIINKSDIPVVLHVIGEGENRYNFVNVTNRYCEVVYHGAIRDKKLKDEIMAKCHAGLNIYKNNLYIGLTVKCIDYFERGLPIINNIKGDTHKMVEEYGVGINLQDGVNLDTKKIINMRHNNTYIYDFYNNNFSKEIFENKCQKIINEVIK